MVDERELDGEAKKNIGSNQQQKKKQRQRRRSKGKRSQEDSSGANMPERDQSVSINISNRKKIASTSVNTVAKRRGAEPSAIRSTPPPAAKQVQPDPKSQDSTLPTKLESVQVNSRDTNHDLFQKATAELKSQLKGVCFRADDKLVTCAHVLFNTTDMEGGHLTTQPITLVLDNREINLTRPWFVDTKNDLAWCDARDLSLKKITLLRNVSDLPQNAVVSVVKKRDKKYLTSVGKATYDSLLKKYLHSATTIDGDSGSPIIDSLNRVIAVHRGAGRPHNFGVPLYSQYMLDFEKQHAPVVLPLKEQVF
jgi:hypothetical protein